MKLRSSTGLLILSSIKQERVPASQRNNHMVEGRLTPWNFSQIILKVLNISKILKMALHVSFLLLLMQIAYILNILTLSGAKYLVLAAFLNRFDRLDCHKFFNAFYLSLNLIPSIN